MQNNMNKKIPHMCEGLSIMDYPIAGMDYLIY